MLKRLIVGTCAGLAGAFAMHGLRRAWESVYPEAKDGIFGFDEEADLASVNLLTTQVLETNLNKADAQRLAYGLHYAVGAGAGAAYALASGPFPKLKAGRGAAFGLALWLAGDELAIGLSGISHPFHKSSRSHVAAAGAHVLYGWTTNWLVESHRLFEAK